MSRYTLELRHLIEDKNFSLFDFEYKLFEETKKEEFEQLFCDYFYFREIGFETVGRFKRELKNKLDMMYPYYKEYWKTVQQVEIERFMETKDVKETFTRMVESANNSLSTSEQQQNGTTTNKSINKFSDTPVNVITDIEKHITNATTDSGNMTNNNIVSSNDETTQNNMLKETTEFHSVGDLGVSSSGILIQGWRDVITNIYQLMFDEMEELFLGYYGIM